MLIQQPVDPVRTGLEVEKRQTHFIWRWGRSLSSHQTAPWGASGKELIGINPGSIPGSGRSPGGGHGNPLQYSCLENPMERGTWQASVHAVRKKHDWSDLAHTHSSLTVSWIFIGRTNAEAEAPILWPSDVMSWLIGKDPDARKDWGQEEKGTAEDEMVR